MLRHLVVGVDDQCGVERALWELRIVGRSLDDGDVLKRLVLHATAATVEALQLERDDLRAEEAVLARRQVLLAEKEEVLADFHRGRLPADAYDALLGTIDARLASLDAGEPASNDRGDHTSPPEQAQEPSDSSGGAS
jgi:hypothetical protein